MERDSDLIALLAELVPEAKASLNSVDSGEPKLPDGPRSVWEIAVPLAKAIGVHPDFCNLSDRWYLGRQLSVLPESQSANLLTAAVQFGPEEAIRWYRKLVSTDRTDVRVIGLVYGLNPTKKYSLINGFSLLPLSLLPDSPNSTALKSRGIMSALGLQFPSAIVAEFKDVDPGTHEEGHSHFLAIVDEMRRLINAYVLAEKGNPVLAESWSEFINVELQFSEVGRTWQSSRTDGNIPSFPINVSDEDVKWLNLYLNSSRELQMACDIPLARLNLALRRRSPGDKALDGSICLEALLSGKQRGELTHRLAVRTALLLGSTLEERKEIASKVRKFYGVRSAVVHGEADTYTSAQLKMVQDGIELCRSALRSVIENGQVPTPDTWEFTGGPSWNRFKEA